MADPHRRSVPELKARWRDLFGTAPPAYNRAFLIKRLAYRLQELAHSGLSDTVRRRSHPRERLARS